MKSNLKDLFFLAAGALVIGLVGCSSDAPPRPDPFAARLVTKAPFGKLLDGRQVDIYTLRNAKGMEARIMNYGGVLVSLEVPDRNGQLGDLVLGYDSLQEYLTNAVTYFGQLIGRYGNRIGHAKFELDGHAYELDANNNGNTLHGGSAGFGIQLWTATPVQTGTEPALKLEYTSRDGEEGFPGTLKVTAIYRLTENNELSIDFTATSDKDTVVNLTAHSYFNLAGGGDILHHVLMIPSDRITPVDAALIPTGDYRVVTGTPFDFREPMPIGSRMAQEDSQLQLGPGYDHNYVFDKEPGALTMLARVSEPTTGRVLEVWSTEPGVQFYSGNSLGDTIKGKGGVEYHPHDAFCLEPQHFPDSPNKSQFPSTELKPGETYKSAILYKFSAQ
jgi:aldose 1-epimerase